MCAKYYLFTFHLSKTVGRLGIPFSGGTMLGARISKRDGHSSSVRIEILGIMGGQ